MAAAARCRSPKRYWKIGADAACRLSARARPARRPRRASSRTAFRTTTWRPASSAFRACAKCSADGVQMSTMSRSSSSSASKSVTTVGMPMLGGDFARALGVDVADRLDRIELGRARGRPSMCLTPTPAPTTPTLRRRAHAARSCGRLPAIRVALRLRRQRQLGRVEAMALRHRRLGAVQHVVAQLLAVGDLRLRAVDVARRPCRSTRKR